MAVYIVQFNDGRVINVPSGEAKFWALMSFEACSCNVYRQGGNMQLLAPTDIKP